MFYVYLMLKKVPVHNTTLLNNTAQLTKFFADRYFNYRYF